MVRQLLGQINVCILKHVRSVNSPLHATIHTQRDHPPETLAVLAVQLGHRRFIARYSVLDRRVICSFIVGRHIPMMTQGKRESDCLPPWERGI